MAPPSSQKPLPLLPTETHAHILSYCDPDTLAHASTVSFAFLQLASPLLYCRDLTITGYDQLQRLFYNEVRSSDPVDLSSHWWLIMFRTSRQTHPSCSSRLDPYLSLDHTRTFTFIGVPEDRARGVDDTANMDEDAARLFYPKRASTSFPIKVDTVDACFVHGSGRLNSRVSGSFIQLFDPVNLSLSCLDRPVKEPLSAVMLEGVDWTRLRTLSADDIYWWAEETGSALPIGRGAPAESLTLTYNLTKLYEGESGSDWFYESVLQPMYASGFDDENSFFNPDIPAVKEVVIQVRSTEQEAEIRDQIHNGFAEGNSQGGDEDDEEMERRVAMIRYEIIG